MKRATKKQIHKACELLENRLTALSCIALRSAIGKTSFIEFTPQCQDYVNFFERSDFRVFHEWSEDSDRRILTRTIGLLLYLEARDDI